ncbi:MAG: hypothetical protein M3253_06265, partial [Chloroflexota bacterium]|nr:hypothetical protein [Chloroflexota bacterium]
TGGRRFKSGRPDQISRTIAAHNVTRYGGVHSNQPLWLHAELVVVDRLPPRSAGDRAAGVRRLYVARAGRVPTVIRSERFGYLNPWPLRSPVVGDAHQPGTELRRFFAFPPL